ncbi:hypothetical protein AB0B45_50600 [Nonomuraea sp. NPDC049152]|uniref:hypothetical protein n=1 Tax=Nonomuraea sp. NPDC049152 TaxID=3154350 RepID=UPI0033D84CA5
MTIGSVAELDKREPSKLDGAAGNLIRLLLDWVARQFGELGQVTLGGTELSGQVGAARSERRAKP